MSKQTPIVGKPSVHPFSVQILGTTLLQPLLDLVWMLSKCSKLGLVHAPTCTCELRSKYKGNYFRELYSREYSIRSFLIVHTKAMFRDPPRVSMGGRCTCAVQSVACVPKSGERRAADLATWFLVSQLGIWAP